jgi:hypothetical protein
VDILVHEILESDAMPTCLVYESGRLYSRLVRVHGIRRKVALYGAIDSKLHSQWRCARLLSLLLRATFMRFSMN